MIKDKDSCCPLPHQVLATKNIIKAKKIDRNEPPYPQESVSRPTLRQNSIKGQYGFWIDIQTPDGKEKEGCFGLHPHRIRSTEIVFA